MIKNLFCILIMSCLVSCASTDIMMERQNKYAPIEQSLVNINQKVASHFLETGIPAGFEETQYAIALEKVCFPKPACRTQAEGIFDSFIVKVRKVDAMFAVMLCDKESKHKVMEDLSCNNMLVEIRSWQTEDDVPCEFDKDWLQMKTEFCSY